MNSNSKINFVDGFISAISFAGNIEQLQNEIDFHINFNGYSETNLESLVREARNEFELEEIGEWSAPKWTTKNDIIYFYLTKDRPIKYVKNLIKFAEENKDFKLIKILYRNQQLIETYKGKIFACARVVGSPIRSQNNHDSYHHKGRIYISYAQCYVFQNPLPLEKIERHIKIIRGATTTPVRGQNFDGIKLELSRNNILPDYLKNAQGGNINFTNIGKDTWKTISCSPEKTFIDESQIRTYFLNYLLTEIKDKNTPLLEECKCYKENKYNNGIVDYCIRINGHWIPVEAKLNISCEKDILAQVRKYTDANNFIATKGKNKGKRVTNNNYLCIVADMFGLSLINKNQFLYGNPENPAWKREEFLYNTTLVDNLRFSIRELLINQNG
ncbi:hypothetical protein GM3708_1546 [Geminocystis sp. NIES-3708]|uniref:hypothetical protein n=1 Tax=Geminocystis sp. NIES-3708 TaxID=1615909 RepID=UPI0005FC7DA1|nr:hypothetical protein [Geminocystis sp. NIES-3708]BAQ61140.1 hypothetical protein GM3708_1546 [Geminocystis sp. NIES-3708]